jgi:DNA-directed RNA polymerase subunit K/omega
MVLDLDDLEEIDEELKKGHANYLLVNIISKRVRAFNMGEKPQVDLETDADPIDIALAELHQDKLLFAPEEPEPLEDEEGQGSDEEE